ncbi:NADPH-dependent F420 reductase [Ramlibacter sp. AW1]|uniref:NADPH-dependent F420 reductase n=1 Tax=Ramlibacter aurantiacus TaxID=2801330 RepID=A0A936ZWQ2_9BURK|nr:NADPH-dependent F420 reductase [Ramlibacter aurantiacus]MBL0422505.1 NADPH-dependent F420 reductase [Ramlibacter aurantiacus]
MKVLVIGAGNMGSGFVKQLRAAGHQVSVTARDAAKAQAVAQQYGAKAVSTAGAADGVDAIVVATPYEQAAEALRSVGKLDGKPVIDITNPLTADYMGLTVGHNTSAAEQIAQAVPGAEVVKGFNTVFAQVLAEGAKLNGQKVTVFVASDSERAKQTARALAESMGFDVIDVGGLKNARYLEPVAGLNIYLGYGAGLGTSIAPTWIRKN